MNCVFRALVEAGSARWVARGPVASAFAPLTPTAPGHTLVVPTSHFADLFDTPPEVLTETMALVRRVAGTMRSALRADGVNVLDAGGPGSEQSVPHLHFHVIPRWHDDGFSTWPTGRSRHRVQGDPIARLASAVAG